MADLYKNNSGQKEYIRSKWVEFAKEIIAGSTHDFGILTFPAEAMQDLHLFRLQGFIDWEEVETEDSDGMPNIKITKGKVRCFEKNTTIQRQLSRKLIQAKVEGDFCPYIAANYSKILSGKDKTFPVDVVNLDFDGRLQSNNKYPFETTVKSIFEFQARHSRSFSLFLTWPLTEDEDFAEYKALLDSVIGSNLKDPSAISFKTLFDKNIGTIDSLDYGRKSVIGVAKIVLKKASQNLFSLNKNEFYTYGGKGSGRRRMISLLFNFKFNGAKGTENIIYSNDVQSSMLDVNDIGASSARNQSA